jgi:hypothetical protein
MDLPLADDIAFDCDVNYYRNMPEVISEEPRAHLIYTVVPEAACSSAEDETSFWFNEKGELETKVAGGGQYCHQLWDYSTDSLKATKKFMGITYNLITYAVERKQIGRHRQLILLVPLASYSGIAAMLAQWLTTGSRELSRFNPVIETDGGKFIRFNVIQGNKAMVTTARPSTLLCATIESKLDAAVAAAARLGTSNLMLPTTASWIGKEDRPSSAVLTEYYRHAQDRPVPTVYPVQQGVRAYQFEPKQFDPDVKPKLQAFMSPLVHEAFAPVANDAGERRCVEGRINSLKKEEPRPDGFVDRCINEFVELVLCGCILEPVGFETVESKQTSAAQKLSLKKAVVAGMHTSRVLRCFIKAEAYAGVKDPRNISTYDDLDKLELGTYALALSEHLKQFPWYGPGKNPLTIANRVAEICSNAEEYVNISDYHRMDGTISYKLREVDRAVFMKAFKHHRTGLNEVLKRNSDNFGVLPNGTTFEQGPSHGSGSADTSVSQTLRAAFTAYLGFRNVVTSSGRRFGPKEAFSKLGLHLGDDGIDADLPTGNHMWAAKRVGLVLEAAVVERGQRGVNFLARYYSPEVWYGRPDSMCDVKRQLSKFHTTVRLPDNVRPEDKLVEKSMSYLATDRNTPVIGQLCQQVLMHEPPRRAPCLGVGTWWSKFDESVQFPNGNDDGWMDVEFEHMLPEFDRNLFSEWLATTRTLKEILEAPLCQAPKPATPVVVDVVVDGDIVDAEAAQEENTGREPSSQGVQTQNRSRKRRRGTIPAA